MLASVRGARYGTYGSGTGSTAPDRAAYCTAATMTTAPNPLSETAAVPHTPTVSWRNEASNRAHAKPTTPPSLPPTPRRGVIRRPLRCAAFAVLAALTAALAFSSGVVSTRATTLTFAEADGHEAPAAVGMDVGVGVGVGVGKDVARRHQRRLGFFDSVYSVIAPGSKESANSAMKSLSGRARCVLKLINIQPASQRARRHMPDARRHTPHTTHHTPHHPTHQTPNSEHR